MSERRLTLRAGKLEVQLLPGIGGSIVRFDHVANGRRQRLLRGADMAITDVLQASCFPLVPFANRIRRGTFACDGRAITLSPNSPGDPSPMHGQGWRAAWAIAEEGERHATLSFRHAAGEWPWEYEATQWIVLDEQGLSLDLSCRNLSPERMPCGLGFHPYYSCTPGTVLDTIVESAWTIDAAVLPVENVPATGRYDLRARHICGQALDNGFEGWCGVASISWPGEQASLHLSSPDAGRFQVYSPPQGGLFVAEPVQNANAALNAPQGGVAGARANAAGAGAIQHAARSVSGCNALRPLCPSAGALTMPPHAPPWPLQRFGQGYRQRSSTPSTMPSPS